MNGKNLWIVAACCCLAAMAFVSLLSLTPVGKVMLWTFTPITFYGRVVDETGKPVEGAKAAMDAADRPYASGSQYNRLSDANGLFFITGIHGAGLQVVVSKDGYYALPQSRGNFGYAARTRFEQAPHTDPADPAVFVLKRISKTEPLIALHRHINCSPAGLPVTMDLRTGLGYGSASKDITIQIWNHGHDPGFVRRWNSKWDWRCVVSVPGGGLQLRNGGEFNFTAPEAGYIPSDEMSVSASATRWRDNGTRQYFVKLASGEYAIIRVEVAASDYNYFRIDSYLNPTPGHRNLQSDAKERDTLAH